MKRIIFMLLAVLMLCSCTKGPSVVQSDHFDEYGNDLNKTDDNSNTDENEVQKSKREEFYEEVGEEVKASVEQFEEGNAEAAESLTPETAEKYVGVLLDDFNNSRMSEEALKAICTVAENTQHSQLFSELSQKIDNVIISKEKYTQACTLYDSGKYEEAIKIFGEVVPYDSNYRERNAKLCKIMDKFDDAASVGGREEDMEIACEAADLLMRALGETGTTPTDEYFDLSEAYELNSRIAIAYLRYAEVFNLKGYYDRSVMLYAAAQSATDIEKFDTFATSWYQQIMHMNHIATFDKNGYHIFDKNAALQKEGDVAWSVKGDCNQIDISSGENVYDNYILKIDSKGNVFATVAVSSNDERAKLFYAEVNSKPPMSVAVQVLAVNAENAMILYSNGQLKKITYSEEDGYKSEIICEDAVKIVDKDVYLKKDGSFAFSDEATQSVRKMLNRSDVITACSVNGSYILLVEGGKAIAISDGTVTETEREATAIAGSMYLGANKNVYLFTSAEKLNTEPIEYISVSSDGKRYFFWKSVRNFEYEEYVK